MKISIQKFMCWDNYTLDLPQGITLLDGPSGSGKSTVFNAISWCLYGRIRKVHPKKNETAKTEVSLSFNNYYIERKKKPTSFLVKTNNKFFENDQAQDFINSVFGTYDIWWAGCYAAQRKFNRFLSIS